MAEIKHEGSRQIFDNPFLEKLTRTHISVPLILFYGTATVLMVYEFAEGSLSSWEIVVAFCTGIFFWTLFEYTVHRFVFHVKPNAPQWRKNLQETLHGVHHEYPRDKGRLAMPPIVSVVLAVLFIFLFKLIFGIYGYPLLAGFLTGYASYLLVHYSVHAFRPPRNFLRRLWINHSLHHYKDPNRIFGVSSQLWDYVFGTMPKVKYQMRSES
jgi:sterol desaturase/sphingolipid hydroxylase (fatty acid hydroxylase superfamily)